MKNYDIDIKSGTAIIEVTIQINKLRGRYKIKVSGNCKGADILEEAFDTEWLYNSDILSSDCFFKIDELTGDFTAVLKEIETGKTKEVTDSLLELYKFIVGVQIVEYKKY